jgi:hypothetical protein
MYNNVVLTLFKSKFNVDAHQFFFLPITETCNDVANLNYEVTVTIAFKLMCIVI